MPLYMDVHRLGNPVTLDEVATAHAADLEVQDEFAVHYLRYWVDEAAGQIFCLVDAPDPGGRQPGAQERARSRRRRDPRGGRGQVGLGRRAASGARHSERPAVACLRSDLAPLPQDLVGEDGGREWALPDPAVEDGLEQLRDRDPDLLHLGLLGVQLEAPSVGA